MRTSNSFFFFNDTATTEIYTLSLHDALPISIPLRSRVLSEQISNADSKFRDKGFSTPGARQSSLQDRKSTRLNSSHSQISYAVFCLKKKIPSLCDLA